MVALPDYSLDGPDGPVRLVDLFDSERQLIVYNHMSFPGEECGRQEEWQDSPTGWPQSPTYSRWAPSEDYARYADMPG